MSNDPRSDELKQKFRPDQSALDAEVNDALAGVSGMGGILPPMGDGSDEAAQMKRPGLAAY